MNRLIGVTALATFCLIGLAGVVPALAQDWRRDEGRNREEWRDRDRARFEAAREQQRDREWREHERRAWEWRRMHEEDPGYVYAPPAVVYSPPAASFSLTIPFDIR